MGTLLLFQIALAQFDPWMGDRVDDLAEGFDLGLRHCRQKIGKRAPLGNAQLDIGLFEQADQPIRTVLGVEVIHRLVATRQLLSAGICTRPIIVLAAVIDLPVPVSPVIPIFR